MRPDPARPLAHWRFDGRLRRYQQDVLDAVDVHGSSPLHLVAPPGSGKTLLGLLLAVRRGRRAVVLAPTSAIRDQWAHAASGLAGDPSRVSTDPARPADLTVLTYQAMSVLDADHPFAAPARERWARELEADGRAPDAAERGLRELEDGNAAAYRRGIAGRARRIRRALVREDPATLARALHPRARALVDRLVAHGVDTVVLDECHHLLDHWALVVASLVAAIRAARGEPLVIGLTATLPSPDDAHEYENYTGLLGPVDYEVPVPAVVREGNLAPYRDLVHIVRPTDAERAFLTGHAQALDTVLRTSFAAGTGSAYLEELLQPEPPAEPSSQLVPPAAGGADVDARLAAAFSDDFAAAEAAAAMLATVAPGHPLVARLPDLARRAPSTDEALRLLGRYASDRLLPDPRRAGDLSRIRALLADFGYALTDRGVRRTRDAVDTVLASSLAKEHGAADILARERADVGDDALRALVVTDFARHGNRHGGLIGSAGAHRTFSVLAAEPSCAGLRVLLVTGSRTRVAARDAAALVPELERLLGVRVAAAPLQEDPLVAEVHAPGAGTADLVRAASALLTSGAVHVVVGTRGLFGEGWDCPAANTLIDLTAVATPAATQQLRGRTLRLDPDRPGKVAHNWTVTAVLPPEVGLRAQPDAARLVRKHARLWGLDSDDPNRIVRGLAIALPEARRAALSDAGDADAYFGAGVPAAPPRELTRRQWRVGAGYSDRESVSALVPRRPREAVFRTAAWAAGALGGAAGGAVGATAVGASAWIVAFIAWGLPEVGVAGALALLAGGATIAARLGRAWSRTRAQAAPDALERAAVVLWRELARAGAVGDPVAIPVATVERERAGVVPVTIEVPGVPMADQGVFAAALGELFGPVRTPRFVLELGRVAASGDAVVRSVLDRAARSPRVDPHFVAVPAALGRRRADAEAFAVAWERAFGPCALHAVDRPEALGVLARARRGGVGPAPRVREEWR